MNPIVKCGQCKTFYQGFHICVDLSTPEPFVDMPEQPKVWRSSAGGIKPRSSGHRANHSESMLAYWDKKRAGNESRDKEIARRYKEEPIGIRDLGADYGLGWQATKNILIRQKVEIRPRGFNASRAAAK